MRELFGIIVLLVIIRLVHKRQHRTDIDKFYFPALFLKVLAGIAVGLTYKFYYIGGDTWSYFDQAVKFNHIAFSNWSGFIDLYLLSKYQLVDGFIYAYQPRAALMVKLVALINMISNNNYWITSAYFSYFSFIGVWSFSTWVSKSFVYGKTAALALFIWPSFVFWSSGILKESVAIGIIFLVIAGFFRMLENENFKRVPILLIAIYLLFLIKYYFSVVLSVVLLLYLITNYLKVYKWSIWKQLWVWVLMLITGFVIAGLLHPNLRIDKLLNVIIDNNTSFVAKSNSYSVIHFFNASNNWTWLLINSPKAFAAALFMPLTLNSNSLFYSLSVIENWILLFLFLRGLFLIKIDQIKSNLNLLIASISYVGMFAIFLALSTPNYGTLIRYKVAYMPVLLVLIFLVNRTSSQGKQL